MKLTAFPPDCKDLHVTQVDVNEIYPDTEAWLKSCSYLVASSAWVNHGVGCAEILWVIQVAKCRASDNVISMKALSLKL